MEQGRIRLWMREAVNSVKAGNKEWAREMLSRVLRANPHHEQAWLWLSAVLESPTEKRYCLERVLAINPENEQAREGLRWLERQAQIEAGAPATERTMCPMCGEPNDRSAFHCVNCGQELFVQCPACGERVDIDRLACGHCGLEIGDVSDGPAYFFHLGELHMEHGHPKRALEAWDKTLILKPDYPQIAEVAAEAFLASGQRDLALQSLRRAIEEAEEAEEEELRRQLRLRLATVYRDLGMREESASLLKELLAEDQERREPRADLYTELGHFYQAVDDLDMAQHYYEMALALDEELHDVRFTLARFLLEEGYEVRAIHELRYLQETEGALAEQAGAILEELRPPIPEEFRNRWQETIRGGARYFLAGLVLLLLSVGRNLAAISLWDLAGVLVCLAAGYFVTAATATPQNLPTFEHVADMLEGPTFLRLRKAGKSTGAPRWFQRFLIWQKKSAQKLAANLRLAQVRFSRWLQRVLASLSRNWNKLKTSRPVRQIKALPQGRLFRTLAAWGKKPFFQAIARFFRAIGRFVGRTLGPLFRRLFPRRGGISITQRLREAVRDGAKRLVTRAGQVELSEVQIYRWMAALLGILLFFLGAGLVLFY